MMSDLIYKLNRNSIYDKKPVFVDLFLSEILLDVNYFFKNAKNIDTHDSIAKIMFDGA